MRKIIAMRDLPKVNQIKLLLILDANRVKKLQSKNSDKPTKKTTSLSKYNLVSESFGVTDHLKCVTDKSKR